MMIGKSALLSRYLLIYYISWKDYNHWDIVVSNMSKGVLCTCNIPHFLNLRLAMTNQRDREFRSGESGWTQWISHKRQHPWNYHHRMCDYINRTVSDRTSKLRMVGLMWNYQTAVNDSLDRKEAVELKNGQIQKARSGHNIEVLLKNNYWNNWITQQDICIQPGIIGQHSCFSTIRKEKHLWSG